MGLGIINITVTTDDGQVFNFAVDPKETIENIKALVAVESGIDLPQQALLYAGAMMQDARTLESYGVKDQDLLFVTKVQNIARQPRAAAPGAPAPSPQEAAARQLIQEVKANPDLLTQLLANNPPLATAVLEDNVAVIVEYLNRKTQVEAEERRRVTQLNADPFNIDAQRQIEEEIRMSNVNANMENAIEHNPEVFGTVHMLYIDCEVNGVPVKAFVDSGAQMTIMNLKCAERCGLTRLIDKRFSGVAKGVGTGKICGRIHLAQIKIGNSFFPSNFTVLEDQSMEFLLGLDYLRRYQCSIDLQSNVLRIRDEAVPFLAEKDLPKSLTSSFEALNAPPSPLPGPAAPPQTIDLTRTTTATPAPVPAPTTKAPPQPQPVAKQANPAGFPEADIQQLMAIGGISRNQAIETLKMTGGNVELAAGSLFD